MDIENLRVYCLSLPGATEIVQWEADLLFKVGQKMFAVVGLEDSHSISFKTEESKFDELIERAGIVPAPYLAKHKWVKLEHLAVLSDREMTSLIANSYELVFQKLPKKVKASILGSA